VEFMTGGSRQVISAPFGTDAAGQPQMRHRCH
jgi:hypothetical protein